jgi:hypothetical protein
MNRMPPSVDPVTSVQHGRTTSYHATLEATARQPGKARDLLAQQARHYGA